MASATPHSLGYETWQRQVHALTQAGVGGRVVTDPWLPTPFVFVDTDILARNVDAMAVAASRAGYRLRPHVKTHKIAAIARVQLHAGAVGLTVAKLSEAEALIEAGVRTEYVVAHPFINDYQLERLYVHDADFVLSVDSAAVAERAAQAAVAAARVSRQIVVVDTGYRRFGVQPHDALALASFVAELPSTELVGIRSHAGHVYGMCDAADRREATRLEIELLSNAASQLRDHGFECATVSIGSTPAANEIFALNRGLVNEVRPGNYVFNDRIMVSLGVATYEQCALRVVCDVIASHDGRALIDGGKLTFSSTLDPFSPGHGTVLGREDAVITSLSQDCAHVSARFAVGDRIVVIPNHACEVTNLAPIVLYGRDGVVDGLWHVDARASVW